MRYSRVMNSSRFSSTRAAAVHAAASTSGAECDLHREQETDDDQE